MFLTIFVVLGVGIYYHANLWPDHQTFFNGEWSEWRIWTILYLPYWQLYGEPNLESLKGKHKSILTTLSVLKWLTYITLIYTLKQSEQKILSTVTVWPKIRDINFTRKDHSINRSISWQISLFYLFLYRLKNWATCHLKQMIHVLFHDRLLYRA